jgi:hypothetical protein
MARMIERWIPTTGDEARDHAAIEEEAAAWIARGYVGYDAEPGEWWTARHPTTGRIVEVAIAHAG